VERLARQAGLSRTTFSNRFNELTTYTPLNYLTSWRMQLARQLLADSDLPIIDVAARNGYQSEARLAGCLNAISANRLQGADGSGCRRALLPDVNLLEVTLRSFGQWPFDGDFHHAEPVFAGSSNLALSFAD
jgi:hypothetical protein